MIKPELNPSTHLGTWAAPLAPVLICTVRIGWWGGTALSITKINNGIMCSWWQSTQPTHLVAMGWQLQDLDCPYSYIHGQYFDPSCAAGGASNSLGSYCCKQVIEGL